MLNKHDLPPFATLPHIRIDLARLNSFFDTVKNNFSDVVQSNQGLCGIHHDLVQSVYKNFEQISLTTLPPHLSQQGKLAMAVACEDIESMVAGDNFISKSDRVRKRKLMAQENTILNEHSYDFKTELLKGSYVEELLNQFKASPTRVRLVKLQPNSTVPPHIDYDPSYAVRVIIPLIADDLCINFFWVKNELHSTVLKPGNAYFLNVGFRHAVVNFSKQERVTLMLSLKGQEDLSEIEKL